LYANRFKEILNPTNTDMMTAKIILIGINKIKKWFVIYAANKGTYPGILQQVTTLIDGIGIPTAVNEMSPL
jgi:hypothetical protein